MEETWVAGEKLFLDFLRGNNEKATELDDIAHILLFSNESSFLDQAFAYCWKAHMNSSAKLSFRAARIWERESEREEYGSAARAWWLHCAVVCHLYSSLNGLTLTERVAHLLVMSQNALLEWFETTKPVPLEKGYSEFCAILYALNWLSETFGGQNISLLQRIRSIPFPSPDIEKTSVLHEHQGALALHENRIDVAYENYCKAEKYHQLSFHILRCRLLKRAIGFVCDEYFIPD